jgi:hypothetical protein
MPWEPPLQKQDEEPGPVSSLVIVTPSGWRLEGLRFGGPPRASEGAGMIGAMRQVRVWAYGHAVDLRKGFDGLAALVGGDLGQDPLRAVSSAPPGGGPGACYWTDWLGTIQSQLGPL